MAVDVSILIVSYNTADLTRRCLESIAEQTREVRYEVIVVDNASTDSSVEAIRAAQPEVELVASPVNLGFARGVNLAAARARGTYLLLLNPDTVVVDGAVDRLVAFARANPDHGLYGGRTLRPGGGVDPSSCWGAPTAWSLACFGLGLSTLAKGSRLFDPESLGRWPRDTVREVGIVTGCLLLVRRRVFAALGGLDARYFMYGEDADFSIRARRAGWRPVITPDATVVHHVGAASARRADKLTLLFTGKATLVRAHFHGPARGFGLAMLAAGVGLRAALTSAAGRRRGRRSGAPAGDNAWAHVWRTRDTWLAGYPPEPVPVEELDIDLVAEPDLEAAIDGDTDTDTTPGGTNASSWSTDHRPEPAGAVGPAGVAGMPGPGGGRPPGVGDLPEGSG